MSKNNTPPYQSIKHLPAFGNTLSAYVAKSQLLDSLTEKIQHFLSPPYQNQCRVANIREKTLVIQVLNPAIATRLRYALPQLKDNIRGLGLDIDEVTLIIKPESNAPVPPTREVQRPSHEARDTFRAAIKGIDDQNLQSALSNLASHLGKGSKPDPENASDNPHQNAVDCHPEEGSDEGSS